MKEFLGFGGYQRIPEGKYTWQHLTFVLSLIAVMIALAIVLGMYYRHKDIKSKNKVFVVKRERKGVKKASLEYTRITDINTSPSLVRIKLHTGRSHQIRVQFASRGFALLGDGKYGAKDNLPAPRLYSCKLTFNLFGKTHSFESTPDWAK